MIRFLAHPFPYSPVSKVALLVFLCRQVELTGGGRGGGREKAWFSMNNSILSGFTLLGHAAVRSQSPYQRTYWKPAGILADLLLRS